MIKVADWRIVDSEVTLYLECGCGHDWVADEDDLYFTCPRCERKEKIKPHPQTCGRCPNRYTLRGCPNWITQEHGFMETNVSTGEERIVTGCFMEVIPHLMQHVIQAANRPAAAIESTRNEIAKGFTKLYTVLDQARQLEEQEQRERLGKGED